VCGRGRARVEGAKKRTSFGRCSIAMRATEKEHGGLAHRDDLGHWDEMI